VINVPDNVFKSEWEKELEAKIKEDQADDTADISALSGQITALASHVNNQVDFVTYLKNKNLYTDMLYWKHGIYGLCFALKGSDHTIIHTFLKDTNDDFVKWFGAFYNKGSTPTSMVCDSKHLPDMTRTGTWVDLYPPNYYTTTVGATISGTCYGDTIYFEHMSDTRGGLWNILIDGTLSVNVSVWAASSTADVITTVASGLDPFTAHTILATFMGADPDHTPSDTARGWVYSDNAPATDNGKGRAFNGAIVGASYYDVLNYASNREFAFGTDYESNGVWIPEHGGVASVTQIAAPVYKIDDTAITYASLVNFAAVACEKFELTQNFYGVNNTVNIAEFDTYLKLTKNGELTNTGTMEALVTFTVGAGAGVANNAYSPMLPLQIGVLETAITSYGETRVNSEDDTYSTFGSYDDTVGVCGVDDVRTNLCAAFTVDHIIKNNRMAEAKVNRDTLGANNGSTGYLKIYNVVFDGQAVTAGYKYYWASRFIVAAFQSAYLAILGLFD
jgi:hypothetical protein